MRQYTDQKLFNSIRNVDDLNWKIIFSLTKQIAKDYFSVFTTAFGTQHEFLRRKFSTSDSDRKLSHSGLDIKGSQAH